MSDQTLKLGKRSTYGGTYANFSKQITIPNSAEKMRDEDVLQFAQNSRKEFYSNAFQALDELDKRFKQSL